ncbi:MAG: VCBS repeat-containing protein [Candidatus Sumerlaeia bacterium]|nr:VCBS repeat-containing protein [Candidatus Sumerlaeia bacterium]
MASDFDSKVTRGRDRQWAAVWLSFAALLTMLGLATAVSSQTFGPTQTIDMHFRAPQDFGAGDIDGNGAPDIVGAAYTDDALAWWENRLGAGQAWLRHNVVLGFDGATQAITADLDGDHDLDAVGAAYLAGEVAWWENTLGNGTAWTKHPVAGQLHRPIGLAAGDLDGDDDIDLVAASDVSDEIRAWLNTGSGASPWAEVPVASGFNGATGVAVADIDGDGDQDIAGIAFWAAVIAWWENAGGDGLTWVQHPVGFIGNGAEVVPFDIDSDGDLDLVSGADETSIAWFENLDGHGGAWTRHTVQLHFPRAFGITAGDADLDGDGDVFSAYGFGYQAIAWWENLDGGGRTWTWRPWVGNLIGARAVDLADLDGDGDLDCFGGGSSADFEIGLAWWENLTPPAVTADEIANHLLGRVTPHPASLDVNADRVVDAADLVAVEK